MVNLSTLGKLLTRGSIVVSEHDLGTWFGLIFMSTMIQWPPLYIETKSAFVEKEKKSRRRRQLFGETTIEEISTQNGPPKKN